MISPERDASNIEEEDAWKNPLADSTEKNSFNHSNHRNPTAKSTETEEGAMKASCLTYMKTLMNLLKGSAARLFIMPLALLLTIQMNGWAQDTPPQDPPPAESESQQMASDIVSTLENSKTHTWLIDALERTGLAKSLQQDGAYTLFAPTDEAIAALPEGALTSMDSQALVELLRYHLVIDEVSQEQAVMLGELMTVHGDTLHASKSKSEDAVRINDALIVEANIDASNGIIHSIDTVLMPSTSAEERAGS